MPVVKMHADEVETSGGLVAQLISAQFPHWAHLPIRAVASSGTDHAMYRLGDDMVARLPRTPRAADQIAREHTFLPRIAAALPLAISTPLVEGAPTAAYPFPWSVNRWLSGEEAAAASLHDLHAVARDLARFILALQSCDADGGPIPGPNGRGAPLALRDELVQQAIVALGERIDGARARDAWRMAMQAPTHDAPAVWVHGDLQGGNLLARDGRLSGVIDWGLMAVGDPACDLMPAWTLLDKSARATFRDALGAVDALWARGRGWALATALVALPYYWDTNPAMVAPAQHKLAEVLGDG